LAQDFPHRCRRVSAAMPQFRPEPPAGAKPAPLADPCDDRPLKDVPAPPAQCMTRANVFDAEGLPDLRVLADHLGREGLLAHELLLDLIAQASELFHDEPNILRLIDPITIVGDIHGQYYDMLRLLDVGGDPGKTQYLFLGDYVDRGSFSIEVVAQLFATKIRNPKRVWMLRGNHESREMTRHFNFRQECEYKYDICIYNAVMDAFDNLPLAATVNGKFLAVHGGLSPEMLNLESISTLDRFREPPKQGLFCDLLWSDPLELKEGQFPTEAKAPAFVQNDVRGCSYFFTLEGTMRFLRKNKLVSLIRAHEAQLEGYKLHKAQGSKGFPAIITIFSAPNYCDVYGNKGAFVRFNNSTLNIQHFNNVSHPYHLPDFMNVFTWSMPFVIEKVSEVVFDVLNSEKTIGSLVDSSELEDTPEFHDLPDSVKTNFRTSLTRGQNDVVDAACKLASHIEAMHGNDMDSSVPDQATRNRLRGKIRTIGRMTRIWKMLRQEHETVIRLKGVCPGHRLRSGLLLAGREHMASELELFTQARDLDMENELRPGSPAIALSREVSRDYDGIVDGDEETHSDVEASATFDEDVREAPSK